MIRAMQRKRNMGGFIRPEVLNGNMYDLCGENILALPLVALAPTTVQFIRSPEGEIGYSRPEWWLERMTSSSTMSR